VRFMRPGWSARLSTWASPLTTVCPLLYGAAEALVYASFGKALHAAGRVDGLWDAGDLLLVSLRCPKWPETRACTLTAFDGKIAEAMRQIAESLRAREVERRGARKSQAFHLGKRRLGGHCRLQLLASENWHAEGLWKTSNPDLCG